MNDDCQGEAIQMERTERCRPELERLSIARRCEQVDRIPNALLLEKTVKACEHCHGNAARQPTSNPCRHRIGFEWKQRSGEFWRYWQPFDFAPESRDDRHFLSDLNRLFVLSREDIPEPADTAGHEEDRSEDTDRSACEQPGEEQRDAECKNDGPRCRRRQIDRAWRGLGCFRS